MSPNTITGLSRQSPMVTWMLCPISVKKCPTIYHGLHSFSRHSGHFWFRTTTQDTTCTTSRVGKGACLKPCGPASPHAALCSTRRVKQSLFRFVSLFRIKSYLYCLFHFHFCVIPEIEHLVICLLVSYVNFLFYHLPIFYRT